MGELLVRYVPPGIAWLLLFGRRGSGGVLRWLLLGLALSLTALTPAGHAAITWLSGSVNLARLVGHAGMVLVAWSAQDLLAQLNGLPRSRWNLWWATGMFAVMCLLYALTPDLWPHSPWVFEYWVVYLLTLTPAFGNVIRLCLRYARVTADRALRIGLRLIVLGTALALAYLVNRVVRTASGRFGFDYELGHLFVVSAVAPNTAHLLVLLGVAVPAVAGWWRRYRRYRRLGPLWQALYEADPAIALTQRIGFWNMRLRLYRRVIEIRDGLLDLQPYRDEDVAATARAGGADEIAVEAAVIAAAITARAETASPARPGKPGPGGLDLDSDTLYLCEVADAFRLRHPH
ncbi:MAB_1171c family putative transporter [Actinokineospora sp. 24-640]